jgi:hypothetical protein
VISLKEFQLSQIGEYFGELHSARGCEPTLFLQMREIEFDALGLAFGVANCDRKSKASRTGNTRRLIAQNSPERIYRLAHRIDQIEISNRPGKPMKVRLADKDQVIGKHDQVG